MTESGLWRRPELFLVGRPNLLRLFSLRGGSLGSLGSLGGLGSLEDLVCFTHQPARCLLIVQVERSPPALPRSWDVQGRSGTFRDEAVTKSINRWSTYLISAHNGGDLGRGAGLVGVTALLAGTRDSGHGTLDTGRSTVNGWGSKRKRKPGDFRGRPWALML